MAERIDRLHLPGFSIIQDKETFCYGIDAVLLADFALKNIPDTFSACVDLGTGNGIIPILLCAQNKKIKVTGLEIQEKIADMAQRSAKLNKLENQIQIVPGDIKTVPADFEKGCADFVTSNPPYMIALRGRQSQNSARMIARQELLCSLNDVVKAAGFLLKKDGIFFMIHRAERLSEISDCLVKNGFNEIKIRLIRPFAEKEAAMALFCSKTETRHENNGACIHYLEDLIIYDPPYSPQSPPEYTAEVKKIYGKD